MKNTPLHVHDMTETNINEAYEACAETRSFYPGLCALDFSNILHLIVRHVIGWDNEGKTFKNGAFGTVLAFYGAVEEQARKTLHVHFILWLQRAQV